MNPLPNYLRDERPWGSFERFTDNEQTTVKLLHVAAGKRFSLQRHAKRSEFWRVVEGSGTVTLDEGAREVTVGDQVFIPVGGIHRLEGGEKGIVVLEIAFGEFDENDIERLEDDFGRTEAYVEQ